MKKAAVYPFNKISQGLIRFRELLDFKIASVIDFTVHVGEDAGEVVDGNHMGVSIQDDFVQALEHIDTLILTDSGSPMFHLNEVFEKYNLTGRWKEVVKKASDLGISIISIHEIKDKEMLGWLQKNRIVVKLFTETKEEILKTIEEMRNHPVKLAAVRIGIYATRPCIGKFTTQMYLLRALKQQGRKAGALITEPTARLFGQYDVDPLRYLAVLSHNPIQYNAYISAMAEKSELDGNDVTIMASQGALGYTKDDIIYSNLLKLSNLVEFNPDLAFLIVGYDDDEKIRNCMDLIRIYCNGKKPAAFLLPDKIETGYGEYEIKTEKEILVRKEELKQKFGVRRIEKIAEIEKLIDMIP